MLNILLQENTFQVVIASDGQQTFVFFIYDEIEWGFANIGFNAGDGVRSFMVPTLKKEPMLAGMECTFIESTDV